MSNNAVLSQLATSNNGGKRKITIPSFSHVEQKVVKVPPGVYPAKVTGFKEELKPGTTEQVLVFSFDVKVGDKIMKDRFLKCYTSSSALWKIMRVCEALGIPEGEIDVDQVIGLRCMAIVEDDERKPEYSAIKMVEAMPASGAPPAGSGPSLPAPPDDDLPF